MSLFKTDARVIEITKLVRDPVRVGLLRAHLEEVIHGEVFGGSPRSQQFLRHAVEKSIKGDFESLKERVIGVELFGRSPSYDKGEDAIVRVTASDVRKRLSQHYGQQGDGSEFRIGIPPGSYIPEISWTPRAGSIPHAAAAPLPELEAAEPTLPSHASQAGVHLLFRDRWIAYLVSAVLCLVAGSFWAGYRAHRTESPQAIPAILPWSAVIGTEHTLQIIASDPDFATEQDITEHSSSLSDYASEKYIPDSSMLSPKIRDFCLKYLQGSRADAIDLQIVAEIVSLVKPSGQKLAIRSARHVRLDDFHTDDDFILLGSPLSDPWVEMFSEQLDFRFVFADKSSLQQIENAHPRGKELKIYQPVGRGFETGSQIGTSFAIVAFVQNPHHRGHVLILAGTGAEATGAAAQFVLNRSELPKLLMACVGPPNEPLQSFEVLLKDNTLNGSTAKTEVVACHRLPSQ
jgi:hypothetical protein